MNIEDKVLSSVGIYPMSYTNAKGKKTERTEWQEGWNACLMSVISRVECLDSWLRLRSLKQKDAIHYWESYLHFSFSKKGKKNDYFKSYKVRNMWFLMNDTFYFASADGESVTLPHIVKLHNLAKNSSDLGMAYGAINMFPIAYTAWKRQEEPLKPLQTKNYYTAYEAVKKAFTNKGK